MDGTLNLWLLRIVFSATCLAVAVLLCALWMRSYWYLDALGRFGGVMLGLESVYGTLHPLELTNA